MSKTDEAHSLRVLTEREYQVLKAVCVRIVPEIDTIHGLDHAQKIDEVLVTVRNELARDFKLLLFVLEYGPPFLNFTFKRFTQMVPHEQDQYLASWEKSKLAFKRMGFQALKRSALAAFYGSEESWSQIGYRGPWLERGYPHDYEGRGIQVPD